MKLYTMNYKKRAKENKKTIVLPETMDRRVLEATDKILKEDIADIILIGNKKDIEEKAKDLNISGAKIIEPIDNELTAQLAEKLYEIRKEKGMTIEKAKQLMLENKAADVIVGARNESLVIYENDFKKFSNEFFVMTDDGSAGEKGFVTDKIKNLLDEGRKYDCIFAVGPLPMMKAVCALTKNYGVKTIVSMNTIMVDGTGMCGSCRLTVDGKVKYACVDGPEFDGHLVDFDEAINRSKFYKEQEKEHVCRLTGEIR